MHPALGLSSVSHGGISMMGVVTNESLLEGTVLVELPRFALLDLELVGSMPEDGTCYVSHDGSSALLLLI